jgi:iduronate 2-sulfatase
LGDHGYWTKHTNYEQCNRIPIIISAPGVTKPGTATRQLAETVDIYPTLSELAGLPLPKGPQPIDGISLVPVLRDPSRSIRDHAFHCYPKGGRLGRAIRTERYRLVEWKKIGAAQETAEYELYDYRVDPRELENVVTKLPSVVDRLKKILARHPEPKKLAKQ